MSTLLDRFTEPPRAFSPVPLWWWSGETVNAERLRWQLERLAAGGVFNVVVMNVAPTSPLYGKDADDPPFMSEPWWELFEGVCRDAEELGVSLWFYDQIGFSGANFQGQVVQRYPEHAGRWLERVTGEGELECPAGGTPLGAAALTPTGELVPVALDGRTARFGGAGRLMLFYAVERGFDYYSTRACERLFDMVHGRFEARVGHLFGSIIVGSFQDELPNLPTWSPDFAAQFAAVAGYDPIPHLAALWEDLGEAGERFRGDYHAIRGRLAEASFFKPLHEWHERHGLLCGVDQQYGAREGHPVDSSYIYGDYVRTHRWFSVPGSDHHGDAKIHSSMAHHYDRPRVWIEAFHTSGWGGTLEETFDWLLPWIGAGANLYNPHATYYSTRSGWWEWAPPSTDWRQPYWRHYEHFARAVARLCATLTWGRHSCDVGVLFPAATARAALRLNGTGDAGDRADELYMELVGHMKWFGQRPGVLNLVARDFDVLDDDTVATASTGRDGLSTAHETYATIVLPGCEVLEGPTARRLTEFVDAGGTLIAVGPLPERAAGVGGDDAAVRELRCRFTSGAAHAVDAPDGVGRILGELPSTVQAPVPTLLRRDGDAGALFVPAVYPRATRIDIAADDPDDWHAWVEDVSYRFDAGEQARSMELVIAGVTGDVELWEPFSGARRSVETEAVEDGVRVRISFDDGPCALLVWGGETDRDALAATRVVAGRETVLDGAWDVQVETTLEDEWNDLDAPAAGTVETWELEHQPDGESEWTRVHATFGPRARWTGPASPDQLPAPGADALAWKPAEWSPSRGIHKDRMHIDYLGTSGRIPEEFLDFGTVAAGEAVHVRALVHAERALATHLAIGASAGKQAWVDGRPVALSGSGYLAAGPVALAAGETVLDLRLTATGDAQRVRGHFAFVADTEGYARPEWLRASGEVSKSSVVAFATRMSLPAGARDASVLVGANGPCRVLVDGVEVGRQGGFDPYAETDKDRLQPYDLTERLGAGEHEIRLELLELGRARPAALLDGLVRTDEGTVPLRSGEHWTATRDGSDVPVDIRLDQRGDPAYNHAWRRPHPLPHGAWLEPRRGTADAGAPVAVTVDTVTGVQRLRLDTPPGATEMRVPLAPGCRATAEIDGGEVSATAQDGMLVVPLGDSRRPGRAELVIESAGGLSGGALLTGPVAFTMGGGEMELADWQDAGLGSHSGAVRYRRRLDPVAPGAAVVLDLGEVRGTAEVIVDGECAGVRVCSPYVFDITGRLGPQGASVEILVLNTLGPHLDAVSPTPYVFAGQRRSGLFGPVRVLVGAARPATALAETG
jgi:hypothetical protein